MALQVIGSEFYSSLFLSILVTILVWLNTPIPQDHEARSTGRILLRTFIISFLVIYAIFYFMQTDAKGEDVIQNIIKTEPDF
jgi:hypothetical protein